MRIFSCEGMVVFCALLQSRMPCANVDEQKRSTEKRSKTSFSGRVTALNYPLPDRFAPNSLENLLPKLFHSFLLRNRREGGIRATFDIDELGSNRFTRWPMAHNWRASWVKALGDSNPHLPRKCVDPTLETSATMDPVAELNIGNLALFFYTP